MLWKNGWQQCDVIKINTVFKGLNRAKPLVWPSEL